MPYLPAYTGLAASVTAGALPLGTAMVLVTLAPGAHVVVVVPVHHDGHIFRACHDAAHREAHALVLSDPRETHAAVIPHQEHRGLTE